MAEKRSGTISSWRQLSPMLASFQLAPEGQRHFPAYEAGQYIALRREDCRLTRRVPGPDGHPRYLPDLDERGRQKRGAVTHAYSIASAPFQAARDRRLEFLVVLEVADALGRFTESLFEAEEREGGSLAYFERTAGDFTLARRAASVPHVLMVATGTGLAPFASMVRELHHDAREGRPVPWAVTLVHANRTAPELAFHDELAGIAAGRRFDFMYVPAVSRPGSAPDPAVGEGRAGNLLRQVLGLPLREEEMLAEARAAGADAGASQVALERATRPRLPAGIDPGMLRARVDPARTVVLTCGNPDAMEDVRRISQRLGLRLEREEW